MNAEAVLKKQAKAILAKNNWVKTTVGFLCVLSVLSLFLMIIEFAAVFLSENILNEPIHLALNVGISVVGLVVFLLLSPIYTGYIKFIAECKDSETGDIQNIFYYFKRGKYFDTIQLNLLLMVKKMLLFIAAFLPTAVSLFCADRLYDYKTIFQIAAVWLAMAGFVVYFLISKRYILTQYLYVADFNYCKERELIKASAYMVKKNFGKVINLYLSYIFWALLCFFVIPIVFVYPYFKHTAILSYSYIYELENNNPGSPYYHSNYPPENVQDEIAAEARLNIDKDNDYDNLGQILQEDDNDNCQNAEVFDYIQQTGEKNFIPSQNGGIMKDHNGN